MKDEEKDMMSKSYYTSVKKNPIFRNRIIIPYLVLIAVFLAACIYYGMKS
ncbi:hypothetical protein [Paenibacillus selenitireducens]|nr:hypothetical protein [Paenibacillus selenitireducens]